MTKSYIFILFLFAIAISLVFFSINRNSKHLTQLVIALIFVIPLACNPTLVPAISEYFSGQIAQPEQEILGDLNNNGRCDLLELCNSNSNSNGNGNGNTNTNTNTNTNGNKAPVAFVTTGGMTVHALFSELKTNPNTLVAKIFSAIGVTDKLETIVIKNTVLETEEKVIENKKDLSLQQAGLKKPAQVVESSLKFLLIPFIFKDNGSLFLNIQSIETPIWLLVYGVFFLALYRIFCQKHELDYSVFVAIIFSIEFVGLSALIEENVGTALRHRSLLLIPILVIWVARKKNPANT
jgi:hypothetical protein